MRKLVNGLLSILLLFLVSCGAKTEEKKGDKVTQKKAQLEELKKQQQKINDDIAKLQEEIAKLDPSSQEVKTKLVAVTPVTQQKFTHYIDLQGKVDAENISYVSPRNGQGGLVKAVYVKQGNYVRKGQLLLKLDDAVFASNYKQLQSQLDYAKDLYQRQNNLWEQKIGTEVQLINARNSVTNLEDQIATLREQWNMTNVYAEMNGVAEEVTIRVGEYFTGNPQAGHIKLVNTGNLKITADVPENYVGRVKEGTNILVTLPDINKTINAKINLTGKIIDPNTRSFYIEARLPADKDFRPNQIALVKIQDYAANNAVTIPLNIIQTDEKGKFVMVAANENGKMVARKKPVEPGQTYGDVAEIKSGLQAGDNIITEGYQDLYDGQPVTTDINKTASL